jgi:hypothetical protein
MSLRARILDAAASDPIATFHHQVPRNSLR